MDLCRDGIAAALDESDGLWFVLHHAEGEIARFAIDPLVLREVLAGRMTLQFSDGAGNVASVECVIGALKVRIEGLGHAPKNCRISSQDVENIKRALGSGV